MSEKEASDSMHSPDNMTGMDDIEFGSEVIRGFTFDNVLHSENNGDIHFGLYVPDA